MLPNKTKFLRLEHPTKGEFAYQVGKSEWMDLKTPPDIHFLLINNPTDEQRDKFFEERGGWTMSASGTTAFISPRARRPQNRIHN